jgi:hypothetical protein
MHVWDMDLEFDKLSFVDDVVCFFPVGLLCNCFVCLVDVAHFRFSIKQQ